MKKLLLHIGYPKTATTSMQLNLFSKLHEENKVNFLGNSESGTFKKNIILDDLFLRQILIPGYYSSIENYDLHDRLKEKRGYLSGLLDKDLTNILSSEHIIGFSIFNSHCHHNFPKRIREIFGNTDEVDIRILISIRKQDSLISSIYNYYKFVLLHKYNEHNLLDFFNEQKDQFDFKNTYSIWKNEFEHVYVLPFEDFVMNYSFERPIYEFLDITKSTAEIMLKNGPKFRQNNYVHQLDIAKFLAYKFKRYPARTFLESKDSFTSQEVHSSAGHLYVRSNWDSNMNHRWLKALSRLMPKIKVSYDSFSSEQANEVLEFYHDSNKSLDSYLPYDLSSLGYY